MKTKAQIRNEVLERLRGASPIGLKRASKRIQLRLQDLPAFAHARVLVLYASFQREVDTHDIIRQLIGKTVLLLPVMSQKNEIDLAQTTSFDGLKPNRIGILEPRGAEPFEDLGEIGLIVVPGVAFDPSGTRLGRGMGYYDRLLAKMPKAVKVGLCYELQIVPTVPQEPHDIRMDVLISETRTVYCAGKNPQ